MGQVLKAPFPWFGGKSRVAADVWARFGQVKNYVEPFFGSGAVLLGKPKLCGDALETVNDRDGYVSNFWRAISAAPSEVAGYADWPVNENDLHARHYWLVEQKEDLVARLEGNPDFYDAKIAGFWVWGISSWVGAGFCSGKGPWSRVDDKLVQLSGTGRGVKRQMVHLGDAGQGVNRRLGDGGIEEWFEAMAMRLRRVRVCCGDWSRVVGPSVTFKNGSFGDNGITGVFLDPPYASDRDAVYTEESFTVAHDVAEWCVENGDNPLLRIALCGYDGEHELPGWAVYAWKATGGMGNIGNGPGKENAHKERIWFSPHCIEGRGQVSLFA